MRLDSEVALPKDPREKTECGVTFQCVGPVVLELQKARTGKLDERVLTPIQILDIIFRQSLTCPFVE